MRSIHPNHCRARFVLAALLLVGLAGCRNQQMAMTNPFMPPDRVPPPGTRLAPGTAQPYYPGDPIPLQGNLHGPTGGEQVAAAATGMTSFNSDTSWSNGAGWTSPSGRAGPSSGFGNAPLASLSASAEPGIAIPDDSDALRFVLPPPIEEPALADPSLFAGAEPIAQLQRQGPTTLAPANGSVSQAVYQASVPAPSPAQFGELLAETSAGEPAGFDSTGPWRSPGIAQVASSEVSYVPQMPGALVPVNPTPLAMPPATIGAELRAVPSPAPELLPTTTPRIRLPGGAAAAPPTIVSPSAPIQANYVSAVAANGGVLQTVAITPLPYGSDAAYTASLAAAPTTVSGVDGFRPRTRLR